MSKESIIVDAPQTEPSEQAQVPEVATAPAPQGDSLPDKFRGKSMEDIVRSYVNVEKELGRSRNELGELRKLADSFIQRDLVQAQKAPESAPTEEEDFFDNPKSAVEKAIEAALAKRLQPIEAEQKSSQREVVMRKIVSKYPDVMTVVQTPEFQQWIQQSPVRSRLYQEADSNHDFDAADELLGIYQSLQGKAATQQDTPAGRKPPVLEGPGSGESSKKIWRRSDLMRMQIQDPQRYRDYQDDILAAYREGRVK